MQEEALVRADRTGEGQARRILVVEEGGGRGEGLAESLRSQYESAQISVTDRIEGIGPFIESEPQDVVLIACRRGPGAARDFGSVIPLLPRGIPVVVHLADEAERGVDGRAFEGAFVWIPGTAAGLPMTLPAALDEAVRRAAPATGNESALSTADVERMRATVARISHDIKNPLAIISGNAQLLGELAKGMDEENGLLQPIQDIEEASERVTGLLHKVQELVSMFPAGRRGEPVTDGR